MNNSPQRAAKGFTRAFWVSNTVELFERMAYYAVFIVLTIYLSSILGLNIVYRIFRIGRLTYVTGNGRISQLWCYYAV